jgi:hypothetical protein
MTTSLIIIAVAAIIARGEVACSFLIEVVPVPHPPRRSIPLIQQQIMERQNQTI